MTDSPTLSMNEENTNGFAGTAVSMRREVGSVPGMRGCGISSHAEARIVTALERPACPEVRS